MRLTVTVDEQVVSRARQKAEELDKSLNQLVCEYLESLAGDDEAERSIAELKKLSGKGDSRGWRFNRDEVHERS